LFFVLFVLYFNRRNQNFKSNEFFHISDGQSTLQL
jgi:hypothetical protein